MTGSMHIGWVGLGAIGTQMVKRLLATHPIVSVYPRGAGLKDVVAAGARQVTDYVSLASQSDILILCVYSDSQILDILFTSGALAALRPGAILIIHTTGSPDVTRDIFERAPNGVSVIDACFSGGPAEAAAGGLTLIVGAHSSALEKVRPLLGCYAALIHHVGPTGHGQALKVLNNLLFATNYMNAVEMLRLAEAQGFSADTVARVLATCSASSFAVRLFENPTPVEGIDRAIRPYMEKDVATAMSAISEAALELDNFLQTARYFAHDHQG